MLRRTQLGLKKAAKDGELAPDGQAPAKPKRGRKPGAKAKAKATAKSKAKAKAAPKVAASKDSPPSKVSGSKRGIIEKTGDGSSAPPEKKMKGKGVAKDKGEKVPKKAAVPASHEIPKEVVQQKCFARRRRPSGAYSGLKWDAVRQAFQQKVKPLLQSYSAHEDLVLCWGGAWFES